MDKEKRDRAVIFYQDGLNNQVWTSNIYMELLVSLAKTKTLVSTNLTLVLANTSAELSNEQLIYLFLFYLIQGKTKASKSGLKSVVQMSSFVQIKVDVKKK